MGEVEFLTNAYAAAVAAPVILAAAFVAFFAVYGAAVLVYDLILKAQFKAEDEADAKLSIQHNQ